MLTCAFGIIVFTSFLVKFGNECTLKSKFESDELVITTSEVESRQPDSKIATC